MISQVKVQVYLDSTQHALFKSMAKRLGVSMAKLFRNWIEEKTRNPRHCKMAKDPFWKCVGRGDSGKDDIAQHFDDYLNGKN